MRYAYPCTLVPEDGGGFFVSFPDVPEALTSGADRLEALQMAEDALAVALAGYVHAGWDIPAPSAVTKKQHMVPLPPVVAAKLALYSAMRTQGVTKVALGDKLSLSESAVRELLNPEHRSHIGQVKNALRVLGRCLVVEDKAA